MFQFLVSLDKYWSHKINAEWYHPALDPFFRLVSNFEKLRFFLAVPLLAVLIFCGNRWRYALLLAVFAVGTADLAANAVKEIVQRPRAYETEKIRQVNLYRYTSSGSGFPSNHSANTMAGVLIVAWHLRRKKWAAALCVIPALLVGYSRIYLGVHYPSDVLAGFAVGGTTAAAILVLHTYVPVISFERDVARKFSWLGLTSLFFFIALVYEYSVAARSEIPLSPGEAQIWDVSCLDWCYSGGPPLTVCLMRMTTFTFGASPFAVRSIAVTMSAGMLLFGGLLTQRIFKSDRTTFFVLIGLFFAPGFLVNALFLDPGAPILCLWAGCCYFLYIAVVEENDWAWWPTAGCVAMGCLAGFTMLYIFVCMVVFFVLNPESRRVFRAKGPYVFTISALIACFFMLVWNSQHPWIGSGEKLPGGIYFSSTLQYTAGQALMASPVLLAVWLFSAYTILVTRRSSVAAYYKYLLSMSLPMLFLVLFESIQSQMAATWAMPAVFTLTILGVRQIERWFQTVSTVRGRGACAILVAACLVPSLFAFTFIHEPASYDNLVKTCGRWNISVPHQWHPAFQTYGYNEMGKWVSKAFSEMPAERSFLCTRRNEDAMEMAFYVEGHPRTYAIPESTAKQRGIPGQPDQRQDGWDAIYLAQGHLEEADSEIVKAFRFIAPPQYLAIVRNGEHIREYTLFKCADFSGEIKVR